MPFSSSPVARSIARNYQKPSTIQKNSFQSHKKQTRSYPIRKQFIFESYLHLLTNNQSCLLFRHQNLSSQEWNSIRGKIKQIPAHHTTPQPPPQLQVLRTRMLLPVLKNLLKQSRISRHTYDSFLYAQEHHHSQPKSNNKKKLNNLTGSLVALSQTHFHPAQLKQALQIISPHITTTTTTTDITQQQQQQSLSKKTQQQDQQPTPEKIQFLVGFIDSSICTNHHHLHRFSTLNSLQTSHSQILSLINQYSQNLLATLNLARASQLLLTLKGFQQTLLDQQSIDPPQHP
ncbi:uncharacterized protein VP01_584g3 [Puccinia sorghi]|uniref:Uncharacterized protein n=1 Tax=Puccinia sorghi TaxID=27349 RepID=A0A0L6UHZ5_9BASI|nr:uncharacterized protein VP01_584g3 [Puccinia sorghi]